LTTVWHRHPPVGTAAPVDADFLTTPPQPPPFDLFESGLLLLNSSFRSPIPLRSPGSPDPPRERVNETVTPGPAPASGLGATLRPDLRADNEKGEPAQVFAVARGIRYDPAGVPCGRGAHNLEGES